MIVSESVLQDWVLQGGVRYLVETTEIWHILSSCSCETRTSDQAYRSYCCAICMRSCFCGLRWRDLLPWKWLSTVLWRFFAVMINKVLYPSLSPLTCLLKSLLGFIALHNSSVRHVGRLSRGLIEPMSAYDLGVP